MQTLAILAPIGVDATAAQQARAHRALMEQMMLIARGHAVDSLPVRCAAALVGSAISPDPLEFEIVAPLAATDDPTTRVAGCRHDPTAAPAAPSGFAAGAASAHREQYRRYMHTIMSGR